MSVPVTQTSSARGRDSGYCYQKWRLPNAVRLDVMYGRVCEQCKLCHALSPTALTTKLGFLFGTRSFERTHVRIWNATQRISCDPAKFQSAGSQFVCHINGSNGTTGPLTPQIPPWPSGRSSQYHCRQSLIKACQVFHLSTTLISTTGHFNSTTALLSSSANTLIFSSLY